MELCGICGVDRYGAGVDRYGAVWYCLWCGQVWSCVVLSVVWTGMELCGIICCVNRFGDVEVWSCVIIFVMLTGMELWRCGALWYYLWC